MTRSMVRPISACSWRLPTAEMQKQGLVPELPASTVVQMFQELQNQGYYVVSGTIHWTAAQVVTYLNSVEQ